jgi:DnaJ domain
MARVVSVRPPPRNNQNMARDLYEVLGVRRDADAAAITRAYRSLARELHPDAAAGGDAERFLQVTEAYEVLSDARSRRLYDRLGWRGRGRSEVRPGTARVYASNPREFLEDLESMIATALGHAPDRHPTRVVGEVQLDAYEARFGATCSVVEGGPVTVPPRTRDLDRVPLGAEKVAIVRIVPPREKVAIRLAATVALVAAIGFLLFLLAL